MKYEVKELLTQTLATIVAITLLLCVTVGTVSCNRDDNAFKKEMAELNYEQRQRLGDEGAIWVKSN